MYRVYSVKINGRTMESRNLSEPFIFLNAWNEWAECTYLEPDKKLEYKYLEAVERALAGEQVEKYPKQLNQMDR